MSCLWLWLWLWLYAMSMSLFVSMSVYVITVYTDDPHTCQGSITKSEGIPASLQQWTQASTFFMSWLDMSAILRDDRVLPKVSMAETLSAESDLAQAGSNGGSFARDLDTFSMSALIDLVMMSVSSACHTSWYRTRSFKVEAKASHSSSDGPTKSWTTWRRRLWDMAMAIE